LTTKSVSIRDFLSVILHSQAMESWDAWQP
jgi:hypothetical protein